MTPEFKQLTIDERVNKMDLARWKPLHLMIYFNRIELIDDMITFAGRSFKKAITIENKKLNFTDDFHPLKLWIKLKREIVFQSLWNLANTWSISHLFMILNEMLQNSFWESIFILVLKESTTAYILHFWDSSIKLEIYNIMENLINSCGEDKLKLQNLLNKLREMQPKALLPIEEKEIQKSNMNTNYQSNSEDNIVL